MPHRSDIGKGLMGWIPQLSGSETRVKNDNDNKISNVTITSMMPSLSSFKDGCFAVVKRATPMFNLSFVSPAMSHGNNGERENFVSSNETQVSHNSNKTSSVGLMKWKLQLSNIKDAAFGVGKCFLISMPIREVVAYERKCLRERMRVICHNSGKA